MCLQLGFERGERLGVFQSRRQVVPFTVLIEQIYAFLRQVLDLNDEVDLCGMPDHFGKFIPDSWGFV